MLKIGYNPDFTVRMKADNVVTGNLSSILPVVMRKPPKPRLPSRNDLRREAIHISAISIPFLVMLFGLNWVVFLISAIVSLYIVSEIARMEGKNLPLFSRITNLAASETELYEFATAPIYFALGILITLIVFPVPENSAAIAIFAAGDSSASLLGGLSTIRNPINKGKTLGGSIGGLLFAFLAGAVFIAPWKALAGAIIAMTVEALPSPLNDNITIPFSAALGITLLQ
jgi:dolichol kinase